MLRISLVFITSTLSWCRAREPPNTYVYVESNIGTVPDQNSIYAFSNDGLGNMTALPGSPYLTDGTGVPAPGSSEINADQEVIANEAGTALYAVNGHSNSIAVFRVNSDGTLTTVPGSPFPSGGQNPVSIGMSGNFLVVANKNFDPHQNIDADVPNYTTFSVKQNGRLRMNPGSTLDLAAGSGPSQALVSGRRRPVWPGVIHLADCQLRLR